MNVIRGRKAKPAHVRESAVDWHAIDALNIRRLTSDSRNVRTGDTFVAYRGETRDGRDYIPQAIANGATAVISEAFDFKGEFKFLVTHVDVRDLRQHAGKIASHVYGRPSSRLWMVGVTGTNGKTSCSHWIAQSLTRMQRTCAIAGTLGNGFPGKLETGVNTTPDAVWLQGKLRDWDRAGARAVAMEVSSHGLDQGRVAGVEFDVALFTNLTRDHLDYHGSMQRYRAAKAKLFQCETLKWSVLNLDDPFGAQLAAKKPRSGVRVMGYGFGRTRTAAHVERVSGSNLDVGLDGMRFDVTTPWGNANIRSKLIGRFNAANLLGTLAVLLASNADLRESVHALQTLTPVPGRAERYGGGGAPLVVVDYAHTPDALEKILTTMRDAMRAVPQRRARAQHRSQRQPQLYCVFGCGGDRDRGKRAIMGRIATRNADQVIVTSDNPRSEEPMAIIADVLEGTTRECMVIAERGRAVRDAIAMARRGDVVVIAGKGHEPYQEIRGVRHRYSDAEAVRAALRERRA